MTWTLELWDDGPDPKRGDLIHTNVGDRRERTWFIVRVKRMLRAKCRWRKYKIYRERWWALDPDTRMALFRSAERAGGQRVIYTEPIRPKRRPTFEQHIRRDSDLG